VTNDDEIDRMIENLFDNEQFLEEEPQLTDEEREAGESNERSRIAFERDAKLRADRFARDQHVRSIVAGEVNKLVIAGVVIAAAYSAKNEYGWAAGAVVISLAGAVWWWENRKLQGLPKYKAEEVDELAEDTVTHERISAYERNAKPWIWVKEEDVHWDDFFDYPYWKDVNDRVRTYVTKSHKDRLADNAKARLESLPYRKAMQAKLREQGGDFELPYWAELSHDELSK
jgi:hypothetical protein